MKFDIKKLPLELQERPQHGNIEIKRVTKIKKIIDLIEINEIVTYFSIQQAYYYLFEKHCLKGSANMYLHQVMKKGILVRCGIGAYKKVKEYGMRDD